MNTSPDTRRGGNSSVRKIKALETPGGLDRRVHRYVLGRQPSGGIEYLAPISARYRNGARIGHTVGVFGRPIRRPTFRYYDQFALVLAVACAAALLIAAVMWAMDQTPL